MAFDICVEKVQEEILSGHNYRSIIMKKLLGKNGTTYLFYAAHFKG